MSDEEKLLAEWRAIVIDQLKDLQGEVKQIHKMLSDSEITRVKDHEMRIRRLEDNWKMAIGVVVGVQILGGIIWTLLNKFNVI